MDWAKAKSILIVAFLITNLFLGYNVFKDSEVKSYAYTISAKRIGHVRDLFEEKNISISANILEKMKKLPQLTVEYETYDIDVIEEHFSGFTSMSENVTKYQRENEIVEIPSHKKSIIYRNKNKSSTAVEMDEKKAEEIAWDFIKIHGFQDSDFELWSVKKRYQGYGMVYEVIYKQKYEDLILDHGYMKLGVKNGDVTSFERRWLKPIDVKDFEKEIIPVTKALVLALDDLRAKKETEDSEVIIEDIKLAFKLDSVVFDELISEEWYELSESTGTGSLYWRICLADQDYIDIRAEIYE